MTLAIPSVDELRAIYDEEKGDLLKVSQRLGLDYAFLIKKLAPDQRIHISARVTPPSNLLNWRPDWAAYAVSVRHNDSPFWPIQDSLAIRRARDKYDAGTHEMCQRRQGEWTIQYCVPRRKRVKPRLFFNIPVPVMA